MLSEKKINVAIDGPAGAGKSTIARKVAGILGYVYVDTGAMYRAVALQCIRAGLRMDQQDRISGLTSTLTLQLIPDQHQQRVLVNGTDVTDELRTPEVNQCVSQVALIGEVREMMVKQQQEMAHHKGVVMDGRDIATHVIPDAEVKIFLTASVEVRAKRRFDEMKLQHTDISIEELAKDIEERDRIDRERTISPLIQATDAIPIDSTILSIDQVAEQILTICYQALGRRLNNG